MGNILISWFSKTKDLLDNQQVNPNGPTVAFYNNFYNHEFHVLLALEEDVEDALNFKKIIEQNFSNIFVIVKPQQLTYQQIDYASINAIERNIILEFKNYAIDILLNTSNDIMRAVWMLNAYFLGQNLSLFHLQLDGHNSKTVKPKLYKVDIDASEIPLATILRQNLIEQEQRQIYSIVKSYKQVYDQAQKIAQSENIPILIQGRPGTGKKTLAKFIHENSPIRNKRQFVAFDCSAYPKDLIIHKLFGYKKGTYPGANHDYKGILSEANGGTVFLENIDALDRVHQNLIRQFIENPIIEPIVGRSKKVNVRLILGVNYNSSQILSKQLIDPDLFYHLPVRLYLPELKDLPFEEKRQLVNYLLELDAKKFHRKKPLELCDKLWSFLFSYEFPGNLTELVTLIEGLYIMSEDSGVCVDALPDYIKQQPEPTSFLLEEVERVHIEKVLKMFQGNKSRTARALGIALNTLKKKIKDYKIDVDKLISS